MHQIEKDQVQQDLLFIQYLSGKLIELLADDDVFKITRSGFYPDEKTKQIEYFLRNITTNLYDICLNKKSPEEWAKDMIIKHFPKNVREGSTKPEFKDEHKRAQKVFEAYYREIKDEVETAREEGRVSF